MAVSIAVGRPLRGISLQALKKRSMITRMVVKPSASIKYVMKSAEM